MDLYRSNTERVVSSGGEYGGGDGDNGTLSGAGYTCTGGGGGLFPKEYVLSSWFILGKDIFWGK